MITINISKPSEYRTQINNKRCPLSTCNTTSVCMALDATGIHYDYPTGMQPEDYLTDITESPEMLQKFNREYKWALEKGLRPRNVHECLATAVNKMVGRDVDQFHMDVPMVDILANLIWGAASVVNGKFTGSGHIVCVVGFETDQDDVARIEFVNHIALDAVKNIIIDDPYGNYHTGYKDHRGNDIRFPLEQFNAITKEYNQIGRKWAHLFKK